LDSIILFKGYELNENYRNTNQITKYCNEHLGIRSLPIGLEGNEVSSIQWDFLIYNWKKNIKFDRRVIITSRSKLIDLMNRIEDEDIIYHNKDDIEFDFSKINVIDVRRAKGLEFEVVGVLIEGMSREEKYVAMTRALSELIIISD